MGRYFSIYLGVCDISDWLGLGFLCRKLTVTEMKLFETSALLLVVPMVGAMFRPLLPVAPAAVDKNAQRGRWSPRVFGRRSWVIWVIPHKAGVLPLYHLISPSGQHAQSWLLDPSHSSPGAKTASAPRTRRSQRRPTSLQRVLTRQHRRRKRKLNPLLYRPLILDKVRDSM